MIGSLVPVLLMKIALVGLSVMAILAKAAVVLLKNSMTSGYPPCPLPVIVQLVNFVGG